MKKSIHICQLNQEIFGLPKLPPNASRCSRLFRAIRKHLTLNLKSASSRRLYRNKSTMINEQKHHLENHPFIIHPLSNFNRIREVIFCIVWIGEMILSPFYMTFVQASKPYELGTYKLSVIFRLVYIYFLAPIEIIIVLLFFITGYIDYKDKKIIIEPTKIIKKYLNSYYIFDAMMCMKFGIYSEATREMYMLNMTCMLRCNTVFSYLREIVLNCRIREDVYDCIRLFVLTLIILNTWNCSFFYIPWIYFGDHYEDRSWAGKSHAVPSERISIGKAYLESMFCIVCHFFGAGEGLHRLLDDNLIEKLILSFVMISGRMWTLYVTASILKIFSIVTVSETKYEEYLLQLEVYMRQKRLPQKLRHRLLEYYKYKYQNHFFNERAIFSTLSSSLRQELLLFGARKLIAKVDLFKTFPKTVTTSIVSNARQIVYLTNDVIVKAGDIADDIYFISSGTVAVTTKHGIELIHLEDGDEIGLIGAVSINKYFYQYTYYAIESTEIYVIKKKDFRNIVLDHGDMLKTYTKKLEDKVETLELLERSLEWTGHDMISELISGKILERPKLRPTHFEN